jgi:type IV pilus assembly protein PilA
MNNKGVTLVELLIVIVVLGIISAFAIPAVGTIVENAERSSVYNDALMVENAARLWCQDNYDDCDTGTVLTMAQIDDYIDGLQDGDGNYTYDDNVAAFLITDSDYGTAVNLGNGEWAVNLEGTGADTLEWTGQESTSPSNLDKGDVSVDAD